jgi:tetratricopeptide (TPR) repeat protein
MAEVAKRFPEDLDAATLYAESAMNLRPWKLYAKDGKSEEWTDEIVNTLEWVLARNPNHSGANHYYIHATEASNAPERALPSAKRLPKIAPAAGHLVHMPAHTYFRTGDYAAAIQANADAARVDENFFSCCGPKGKAPAGIYPVLYYSHNLHFLAIAAAMAGRSAESGDAARRLAGHIDAIVDQAPMAEVFGAAPLLLAARQAQWGEVARWPRPKENRHATLAAWHLARGLARASTKDIGPALEAHDAFAAEVTKCADAGMGQNSAGKVFKVGEHLLSGKIFAARGDNVEAKKQLELAVKAQDDLEYDEPPAFPWPVREALGAFLLRSGDAAGAEKVFREDLVRTPNNPRSLFGLAEALKAKGRHFDAEEVRKQFQARWAGADVTLRIEDF